MGFYHSVSSFWVSREMSFSMIWSNFSGVYKMIIVFFAGIVLASEGVNLANGGEFTQSKKREVILGLGLAAIGISIAVACVFWARLQAGLPL